MDRRGTTALAVAFVLLGAGFAAAEDGSLTLEQALALARERGPALLAARERVEEARGRLLGASALLRENPSIEGAAGRRSSEDDDSFAGDVAVLQSFELGGRRAARIRGAEASLANASAAADDALRRALREVAETFQRAVHAREHLRLAREAETVASDIVSIAERRYRADDVPVLDVNLARSALARARAERLAVEAEQAASLGALRVRLGMRGEEALAVEGELRAQPPLALAELLARVDARPDLKALEAELREGEAELALARGAAWPELGLGARYERDEGDDIVLGALTFTVPLFDRGQGERAEAGARIRRLRLELEAARRAAGSEVRTAFDVAERHAAAVAVLERDALPLLDENERLSRRSYEAGQIGLADLLLVRREILETRSEYLDRLLEAAIAAIDLEASAGGTR